MVYLYRMSIAPLRSRDFDAWAGLPERYRWKQAGLYMDASGLGRPLPSRQLLPPAGRVTVVDGRLVAAAAAGAMVDPPPDLLERFVRLRQADDVAVAAFAERWGFLFLCEHGHPAGVHADVVGNIGAADCQWALDLGGEPCSEWRDLASEAWSCLEVAASLYAGRPPQPQQMQRLLGEDGVAYLRDVHRGMRGEDVMRRARTALQDSVTEWLQYAMVRLVYRWAPDWPEPRLELGSEAGSPLVGELAMQLAFATARAGGFAVCAECGDTFAPTRRPKVGQRAFCATCRADGAPQRAAARDWARRRKEASRG